MHHFPVYTIEVAIAELQEHYPNLSDEQLNEVRHAYEFALLKHSGQYRISGETYINHPLRAAIIAANSGCDYITVMTCILHDTLEDTNTSYDELVHEFSPEVADLVNTVTAIDKEITDAERSFTKSELDRLSDLKLISMATYKAVIVKAVDRLDNILDICHDGIPYAKRLKKCQDTKKTIIPMLKRIGAYSLLNEIEDAMLLVQHKDRYLAIDHEVDQRITKCSHCTFNDESSTEFLSRFSDLINDLKRFGRFSDPRELVNENTLYLSKVILSIEDYRRSVASFYREIVRGSDNIFSDGKRVLTDKTPLYDIVLVISDDASIKRTSDKLYSEYLTSWGCTSYGIYKTSYKDAKYDLIRDSEGTYYRFFIKRIGDYLRNRGITDSNASLNLANFIDRDDPDPASALHKKIKVFLDSGAKYFIDSGSTIHDLAFAIDQKLGLHCMGAYFDKDHSFVHDPSTILSDGDMVTVCSSQAITPSIEWFVYLRTTRAKKMLCDYFSRSNEEI